MNAVEATPETNTAKPLAPPLRLEVGSIVLLKMRGHTRTQGLDYYAPAVVLNQYQNDTGDLEVLVWDATAGTHYNPCYPVRELSSRGEGNMREIFESATNIGGVLFSPEAFSNVIQEVDILQAELRQKHQMMRDLLARVEKLEAGTPKMDAKPVVPPVK